MLFYRVRRLFCLFYGGFVVILSLGHSTFGQSDFVDVCLTAGVDVVVDVRSHPGSVNFPHFNRERMECWLSEAGVGYEWWPGLGGWDNRHVDLVGEFAPFDVDVGVYCDSVFPKQRIAKKRKVEFENSGFTNFGFHDYQFFMTLPEFFSSLRSLVERSGARSGRPVSVGSEVPFGGPFGGPGEFAGDVGFDDGSVRLAMVCCEACWSRCHRGLIADCLVRAGLDVFHVTPSFRKIKLPRTRVKLQSHAGLVRSRLGRFDSFVLGAWDGAGFGPGVFGGG